MGPSTGQVEFLGFTASLVALGVIILFFNPRLGISLILAGILLAILRIWMTQTVRRQGHKDALTRELNISPEQRKNLENMDPDAERKAMNARFKKMGEQGGDAKR